jgi:hypothetical protein
MCNYILINKLCIFILKFCFFCKTQFRIITMNKCRGGEMRDIIYDILNEISNTQKGINRIRNEILMVEPFWYL